MNEFKDYATMVEEKKIKAKKKRDEAKELRLEANFKERQERYKTWEEDRDIIRNVREHFTAEQIANKEYLQNTIPYRLQDITKMIDEGNYEGMSVDMDTIQLAITDMDKRLDMLDERLDMLEGKPPYLYAKSFDA